MNPTPDKLITLAVTKIMTQLVPEANDYQKGDLMLLAGVLGAVAERYEHDAEIYLHEHQAMRAIFRQALADEAACAAVGAPVLAAAAHQALEDFRMSALRRTVEDQLRLLGRLHEWADSHSPALKTVIEKFLADHVLLHALECGPYKMAELGERKSQILQRK